METFIIVVITAVVCSVIGGFIAHTRAQKHVHTLAQENVGLKTQLEAERRLHAEKTQTIENLRSQFTDTFALLSSQALARNNEEFLRLAKENLQQFHVAAQGSLEHKEKAIENMLKPIKDALEKTEKQVHFMEKDRKEAYGSLHKHLELLTETQQKLQGETRNLVAALRRPEVRGQWGEITLKRLCELAGMVEYCDFFQQESVQSEQQKFRPDMIVRLPGSRDIVVDSKTPLDAYLSAMEASDDASKQIALVRHARQLRDRVKELSSKAYWTQFQSAPDFVVLFIPGDQFLSSALDIDRDLLEDALKNKVILATPTSFVALLRAVAFGWRQEQMAENAQQIRELGIEMVNRVATFTEYLSKLGQNMERSVTSYNQAVASFNTRIAPQARKFAELGIEQKKELQSLEPISQTLRALETDNAPTA